MFLGSFLLLSFFFTDFFFHSFLYKKQKQFRCRSFQESFLLSTDVYATYFSCPLQIEDSFYIFSCCKNKKEKNKGGYQVKYRICTLSFKKILFEFSGDPRSLCKNTTDNFATRADTKCASTLLYFCTMFDED